MVPDLNYNDNLYTFGADGKLIYNDSVWDDLRFPAISLELGPTKNPDWVQIRDNGAGSAGVYGYAFDASAEEEIFMMGQMPHKWKEGSGIEPHVHWVPTSTDTGVVRWAMECTFASPNSVFPVTTFHYVEDAGDGTLYKHQFAANGTISMAGNTLSMMILCRVFRDATHANDTYADDAVLLEFDLHYEIDAPGSAEELVK